jgi:glutamyl-tRNA synthetase
VCSSDLGIKPGNFMMALRMALTGSSTSLPLFETMAMLGRDRCMVRLKEAAVFVKARLQ